MMQVDEVAGATKTLNPVEVDYLINENYVVPIFTKNVRHVIIL
jgi:hypothetical protein